MPKADVQLEMGFNSSRVKRGLRKTESRIKQFSKSAVAQVGRVAGAFAGVALVKSIIGLGTAAAETASKFKAVFGPATEEMNERVQELRRTIPATTAEMQGALATFAQMAGAFGLNEKAARMFSVEMVKIAGDLASFNNLGIEETFTKIRSAISGEFEPMKQLGIVINQARIEQEALNLAVWDGTGQMSAAQKALAVQSILIRDMGTAHGDAAATAASAANQMKFLRAELVETGTEIGVTILPAVVTLTEAMGKLLNAAKNTAEGIGTFVGKVALGDPEDDMRFARGQARLELEKEGSLKGMSKGERHRAIEARAEEVLAKMEERKKIEEGLQKAEEAKKAALEEELKTTDDLKGTLEELVKVETDPVRKKSYEERLAAINALIEAAGELQSIETSKPGSRGGGAGGRAGSGSSGTGRQSLRQQFLAAEAEREASWQKLEAESAAKKPVGIQTGRISVGRIGTSAIGATDPGSKKADEAVKHQKSAAENLHIIANVLTGEE